MIDLLRRIRENNLILELDQGKLKVHLVSSELNNSIISEIKEKQAELIMILQNQLEQTVSIPKLKKDKSYAISDAQRRLWVLSQFEGGSVAYNMPFHEFLSHEIDIACLRRSIYSTIDRHEILRTVFKEDDSGEVRQWILVPEELGFEIDYRDYRNIPNQKNMVQSYIEEDSQKKFDLSQGPLLRAALLQVEDEQYIFYFNMHHIISDGWSMEVLSKDVFSYYDSYLNKREPDLKPLHIQYKDYSMWQLSQLEGPTFKAHQAYWVENLQGDLPLLDLPGSKQRPSIRSSRGQSLGTYLNKSSSKQLKEYVHHRGGSLFMGLLASFNVLLYRYTGQEDLIIGCPIAGRGHADLENQIGFYVNTLALRTHINPEESFDELFSRVRQNTLNAYSHQMYPFDRLVDELSVQRDLSRSAVFDVMLVLQNNGEKTSGPELKSGQDDELFEQETKTSKFDLLINFQEQGDYFSFSIEYNTDVYERKMIDKLMVHYKNLLSKLLSDPLQSIGEVDYLSQQEKQELLFKFNDTKVDYPAKTVITLFEEQVIASPDKVALMFEEKTLTYKELNQLSNNLAHYLINECQISRTGKVGVMLERSLENCISMIGVMKSGACYVPVDPDYPSERVSYIVKDSDLDALISSEKLYKKYDIKETRLIDLSQLNLFPLEKSNPEITNHLDDASYVIYTSGSTGKPKGVLQTHRMLSNLIQWDIHHSGITTGLKHLQYSSFSFDASLHDLYFVLSSGGSAYIVSEPLRLNYQSLKQEITDKGIEVLSMPFSALNAFCIETEFGDIREHTIRYIVSTAEQLYVNSHLEKFLVNNPQVELHNHYGPSESHVVTSYKMSSHSGNIESRASIGQPISNSWIYILDTYKNLVPQGVAGELYIGGENIAKCYLNLEKETKDKFIADPFKSNARMYKTGDQAYWRPDGNIEFIGRHDDQVKIRGYRIELGEIEQAMLKNGDIQEAVVLAKSNEQGEKELVAYIVSDSEQDTHRLRTYLQEILPVYMLPSYYVQLKAFPLTSNGKIDKKSLPDPHGFGLKSGIEYVAPRNEIEQKLVKIWQEILQRENIGVKDDFFTLGGNSIKAIRFISKIQKEYNIKFELAKIFQVTTIDKIAEFITVISVDYLNTDSEMEEFKI